MDSQTCPCCAHPMARGTQPMTLPHKGFSATFDMPGWYCAGYGESVHTVGDMRTLDRHLNLLKDQAENDLPSQAISSLLRVLEAKPDVLAVLRDRAGVPAGSVSGRRAEHAAPRTRRPRLKQHSPG